MDKTPGYDPGDRNASEGSSPSMITNSIIFFNI